MKVNIYGCGLSGVTAAIILKEKGHDVEIFEVRDHIAGNCFDHKMDGVTVHEYGCHFFHTNNERVWEFLNRYTKFNNFENRVRANTSVGQITIPFSKLTEAQLGMDMTPKEIQEVIFRDYSERHWGIPWEELPKSISGRVPNKRDNFDNRYFTDKYQGIPEHGYTKMFENMLDGIKVNLGVDKNLFKKHKGDLTIWTGKISDYYDTAFGHLPYRSLRFEHTKVKKDPFFNTRQGNVLNECNTNPWNRTCDNSVFLDEQVEQTIHTRDYPEEFVEGKNEPIYPKPFGEAPDIYNKYKEAAKADKSTIHLGRLATYKYLDMWMAVAQVQQHLKNF